MLHSVCSSFNFLKKQAVFHLVLHSSYPHPCALCSFIEMISSWISKTIWSGSNPGPRTRADFPPKGIWHLKLRHNLCPLLLSFSQKEISPPPTSWMQCLLVGSGGVQTKAVPLPIPPHFHSHCPLHLSSRSFQTGIRAPLCGAFETEQRL